MCRLFETIQVRDGVPLHLPYHQKRVDRTLREIFGKAHQVILSDIVIPLGCRAGIFKLRVDYGLEIDSVQFDRYVPKPVSSLKLVTSDTIGYEYKYRDRSLLESLLQQKEDCDEILIVKGGLITDTSYSNIAFRDDQGWVTPRKPLLKGTCRARLVAEGVLREADIRPEDILTYHEATLINAMLDPGLVVIDTRSIR